jgi:hypothetical protein
MPLFEIYNVQAAVAQAQAYWDGYCNQFYLLDGEPYETGPEWIYVEIQGDPPDHRLSDYEHFKGEKMDNGFNYIPCLNLKTGVTIYVRMSEWPQRCKQECTQFHGGDRFKEIKRIDNAMEVLAWASL